MCTGQAPVVPRKIPFRPDFRIVAMPLLFIIFALINLALGFALAVYLGAAPRYAGSRILGGAGRKEPSGFIRRIVAFLPKRKPSH